MRYYAQIVQLASLSLFLSSFGALLPTMARAQNQTWCYERYENRDSSGNDIDALGHGISTFFKGFDENKTMNECSRKPECKGFNTDGILKYRIRSEREWNQYNGALYIKVACGPRVQQPPAPTTMKAMSARMIAANLNNHADCFCNRTIDAPSESDLNNACRGQKDLLYATYFIQCLDKIDFCSDRQKYEYDDECQNTNVYTWLTESCRRAITPSCLEPVKPQATVKVMTPGTIAANLNNRLDCFCEEAAFNPRAAGIARACRAPNDLVNATYFIQCLDQIDFCAADEDYYESQCQDLDAYDRLSIDCRNAITPSCK